MAKIVIIYPRQYNPPVEITSFRARMARYGLIAVASYLQAAGHQVSAFCELSGAKIDHRAVENADYILFSFLSFCANRAYELADRYRKFSGAPIIMGGSHASVLPEEALGHCDYVIRNEGERPVELLLNALENGKPVGDIPNLSYKTKSGEVIHNATGAFTDEIATRLDLDLLPDYRSKNLWWNLTDALQNGIPRVAMPVVQASRGCAAGCRFCTVKYQLGTKYRKRNLEDIYNEIDNYFRLFRSPYLFFADNDLSYDEEFSCRIFEYVLEKYGAGIRPYLFGRIHLARRENLLEVLERFDNATAGIGFESLNEANLQVYNKGQSVDEIEHAVSRFKSSKVNIHGLFIFGSDYDDEKTVDRTINFSLEHDFFNVGLCALYDFPGKTEIMGQPQLIEDKYFIHTDWRFYSANFVVHYPKNVRPSVLQRSILNGFDKFGRLSKNGMYPYLSIRPTIIKYIEQLKQFEHDFYDSSGNRLESKFEGRSYRELPGLLPIKVSRAEIYHETFRYLAHNMVRRSSWKLLLPMLSRQSSPG